MVRRFSFILTWLLLLAFGVPSIGGTGLHLFLDRFAPHESGCCCAPHAKGGAHHHETSGSSPNWESSVGEHDANHCFLCHFLTQSPETAVTVETATGLSFSEKIALFTQTLHSYATTRYFSRGPPEILS